MICPYCQNEHPDRAKFCPVTGQSLESFASGFITCPYCRNSVPSEAQFCPICGNSLAVDTGGEQGAVQPVDQHKNKFIWLAGLAAIIIIATLVLISLIQGRPKPAPAQLPIAALTRTTIAQQTKAMLVSQGNQYSDPAQTLVPSPTRMVPTFTLPPTMTIAPTEPERKTCPGAPPIRVEIGDSARVIVPQVYARSNPVVGMNVQWYFFQGKTIKILNGPVCSNDVSFFKAQEVGTDHIGWIAEAEADTRNYYIEPVP